METFHKLLLLFELFSLIAFFGAASASATAARTATAEGKVTSTSDTRECVRDSYKTGAGDNRRTRYYTRCDRVCVTNYAFTADAEPAAYRHETRNRGDRNSEGNPCTLLPEGTTRVIFYEPGNVDNAALENGKGSVFAKWLGLLGVAGSLGVASFTG